MIGTVKADEYQDITNDVEIRYKWYKEIVSNDGDYYPLKDIKETDKIDLNNIKYVGEGNHYKKEHCSLPAEYYLIKEKHTQIYNQVHKVLYIMIENIESLDDIKIYYENEPLKFEVESFENKVAKLYLRKQCMPESLLFYVNEKNYTIGLYKDKKFEQQMLYKEITDKNISIPDKTWITPTTEYMTYPSSTKYKETDFTKFVQENITCAYQEKYIYKYNTTKEYFDDKYHGYVEGYIKDINDYKIYYNQRPINNTIEIIKNKIIEIPKVEYVYKDKIINSNDSSTAVECIPQIITKTNKEYIEKEVSKIPKLVYIIFLGLIIIIILLTIKAIKKNVDRSI